MKIRCWAGVSARPSAIYNSGAVGVVLKLGETKRQPAVRAPSRRLGSEGFACIHSGWVTLVALEGCDVCGGDVRVVGVKACPIITFVRVQRRFRRLGVCGRIAVVCKACKQTDEIKVRRRIGVLAFVVVRIAQPPTKGTYVGACICQDRSGWKLKAHRCDKHTVAERDCQPAQCAPTTHTVRTLTSKRSTHQSL